MKNFALLIIVLLTTITASAQRIIDLEVTNILKPDTVQDSREVNFTFTIKNNGPDDIKTTDTIVYQIRYRITVQTITFPSDGTFYTYFPKSTLKSGDSLSISGTIKQQMDVLVTRRGDACAGAFVINETDKIKDEAQTSPYTATDNSKCKGCLYYDPAIPGLKVAEPTKVKQGAIKVYPNPAQTEITFVVDVQDENHVGTLKITDISGRTLLQENINCTEDKKSISLSKNISAFAAGMYFVEIKLNKGIFTGKIIKQ